MPLPRISFCFYYAIVLIASFCGGFCKIYEQCELARELKEVHRISETDVPTWVCLARHESEFNTSAVNEASGDHGLFQISQQFWCSPPGEGHACGLSCDQLKDENIKDDVICAKRIFREHKRLSGDGFNAWVVYRLHCSDGRAAQYAKGCFTATNTPEPDTDNEVKWGSDQSSTLNSIYPTTWKSSTPTVLTVPPTTLETGTTTLGSTTSPFKTSIVYPSPNSLGKRLNYPYVNNIVKYVNPQSSVNYASANIYNVVKQVPANPTQPTSTATYLNTRQTSSKPVSNTRPKGFRVINGIVTYY